MDVKFKNGLANCFPSKIDGYGAYRWENPSQLLDIPQLPKVLFELISRKTPVPKSLPTPKDIIDEPWGKISEKNMEDIKALSSCLTTTQLDDYSTWIKVGMILKKLGAPLSIWEVLSKRSKKFKLNDCSSRWAALAIYNFSIISLLALAKQGDIEKYNQMQPRLHFNKDVFDDAEYPCIEINTPFLTTKTLDAKETYSDQVKFRKQVDSFMIDAGIKSLVLKSRYGSGKTTFMQRLIKEQNPKRVLFVTYRQTLARDIMRNFGKLGFKNYLDASDDPTVWESPRLIIQVDSLMKLLERNASVMNGDACNLKYDMIVLDESESLLCHATVGSCKT